MSLKTVLAAGTALAAVSATMPATALAQTTPDAQTTTQPAPTPTGAETPASGAPATADTSSGQGSEILVTGSRIRRDPNDSALPLQIVTTQELQRNGISSPEQLIGYLTTNGTGSDNLASNADVVSGQQRGNNGASFANLRGQGSGATLVLLNGRRVAAHGLQGSAVDVNQIPFAAIERVEVLKEGASAIYGTDAIGGVINFIMRKDYQGVGLQAFADIAEGGDHTIYRTSAIAGYGDLREQGFNVMAAVSFSDMPELRGDQRDFVNTFQPDRGLSPDTRGTPFATIFPLAGTFFPNAASTPFIPGTTTLASGGINVLDLPGGLGCGVIAGQGPYDAELWATPTAGLACAFDTGRSAVLQQPLETLTWFGRGVARFGEHEVTVEATGSDATAAKRFSEVQITPNTTTQNYAHPVGAPGYAFVYSELLRVFPALAARAPAALSYRFRCVECGRREIVTDTQTARYTLGLDGPLFGGWDYRTGISYAESQSKSTLGTGYYYRGTTGSGADDPNAPLAPGATRRGLIGLLNSGLLNPFLLPGQSQSAAALAALEAVSAEGVVLYGGKYSVTQADASISGGLFDLPAGTVRAAIGVDYRKEKYRFNGDEREAATRPTIIAAPFDDANQLAGASREIKAAYAEVLIPVLDSLEVTVAGRVDDYGDFGTTTNPMASFKFRPFSALMFRGNYNTAFRVPAFNQLFNGTLESLYTGGAIVDPFRCPSGVVNENVPGCESLVRSIDLLSGGNRDLEPETAKMYSLGAVFEPSRNFSASVDFFSIDREGTIQALSLTQALNNFALVPQLFIRDQANGPLQAIDLRVTNLGGSKTEGFEIAVRGGIDALSGRLDAGLDATYLTKKKEQVIAGGPFQDRLGVFAFSGDLGLKWKHNAFISYRTDMWTTTLTQIFRSGYTNQVLPGIANGTTTRPNTVDRVDEYVIYNLSVAFTGLEGLRLSAGIKNLFDTDPPFAISYDSNTGGGSSWEPRVADPRGRSFTIAAEVKF
ncbi:TonB-dependent receptor domain-containing protein [Tsuneonella sp. SYSU-LHT278]|uniref:TonB-dependent receptor domain-containing protein n=1 Tax=Tsuneonella sediminis TaxID=3416089 RepID=UPI003F7A33B5